jgi:hypothetical protein
MLGDWLRARAALDDWFAVAVAVLVVLAGVGAWAAYGAYVAPGTTAEERTVDEWRVAGAFDHRATVTPPANGTAFEPGSTVENRSLYLTTVMPELEGSFTLGYRGEGPATVRLDERVRVRSVAASSGGEEQTVYWQRSRTLESGSATLRPGGRLRIPFALNVSRTAVDAGAVNERLRSPGQIQVDVVVDVVVDRQNGPAQSLTFTLPIRAEGDIYRVESGGRQETFSRSETVAVPNDTGPLRSLGGPLLAAVATVGAVGLATARRRGIVALSARERAWLDYRDDRDEFDEWITTIRLPPEARELPVAEAVSLADLVDFAIDAESAVLESPDSRRYHVVHDGYRYTYEAPPEPGGGAGTELAQRPGAEPNPEPGEAEPAPESED